jgi:outer membrane protein OmpA-like peptidoglycan-associated protein
MKKVMLIQILVVLCLPLPAKKYEMEKVNIIGLENPVYVTISPDGLRMIIIDWPKKSYPILKQTIRTAVSREWSGATEIPEINEKLNAETQIKSISFGYDNKFLYFSAHLPDSKGGLDIYSSEITLDGYADPVNLGSPINTERDENFPSVSGNNRELIFTRDIEMKKIEDLRPGEIWMSHVIGLTDQWAKPEKINIIINDGGIGYPKIYGDNKTLFYSRADEEEKKWKIHWTKRIGDIHWYLPVKLDTLSSDDHEVSPFFCKQDGFLYYLKCTNMESVPKGEIYRFRLTKDMYPDETVEFEGSVGDSLNKTPIGVSILVTDPVLGRTEFFTHSDVKNGNWHTLLVAGKMYMFHFWKENYSHHYQLFNEKETMTAKKLSVDLTPQTELTLNIYDKEELWPLEAEVQIINENGNNQNINILKDIIGQQKMPLPIGKKFLFQVSKKDYLNNRMELDLSSVVLFDKFVRDVELEPIKRNIEVFVTEKDTNKPLKATVEFIDRRNKRFKPDESMNEGHYNIALREGEPFNVEIRGPKYYAFKHVFIDLDADRQLKLLTVELSPLTRKVPIRLNNINFELNSADLMESSLSELDRVVQLLKDNPEIYVEMSAHTCDIGSDRFNDVLSDKRAKSVVNYLILKGINYKRMVARGYGEKVPLVPNDNEENRSINRRVELKILDENDQIFQIEETIKE